jgi:S1-C subfamily serine protease
VTVPPRYLGRRHSLSDVDGHVELRDRFSPDEPPVRYPASAAGWTAAIAELRRRDGAVIDASTGQPLASPGRRRRWLVVAGAGLCAVLLAAGLVRVLSGDAETGADPGTAPLSDAEVVDLARKATMLVVVYQGEPVSVGSGWLFDATRGLVVTNAHVVDGGTTFRAGVPGRLSIASLVAEAPCEDLAVLRIGSAGPFEALELAPEAATSLGDRVVAMGFPPRLPTIPEATQVRWTFGSVSYLPDLDLGELIEHSARLDPGNSGGPLVDMRGRLVGVNVGTGVEDPNLGFAIPVERVRAVIPDLLAGVDVCA